MCERLNVLDIGSPCWSEKN